MLVKLPVWKASLRHKPPLKVAVRLVQTPDEVLVLVAQLGRRLPQRLEFLGRLPERGDRSLQLGKIDVGIGTLDGLGHVLEVGPQLGGVVDHVEGDDLVVEQVEDEKGEVLAHGRVDVEARVAKGGHPVVRVVVAVVVPDGVAGALASAEVDLETGLSAGDSHHVKEGDILRRFRCAKRR